MFKYSWHRIEQDGKVRLPDEYQVVWVAAENAAGHRIYRATHQACNKWAIPDGYKVKAWIHLPMWEEE